MATLTLDNLTKRYRGEAGEDILAVNGLDLDVADGEFLVLVGPSGCGKSTALRMIAGLERITAGEFLIDGRRMNDLDSSERDIAMVFQTYALYPHLSVYRNIAYPLRVQRVPKAERDERVRRVAGLLDLSHLLDRRPGALSGGQRQRVAMGRALVREPKAFLMDEPLSNLDAKLRVQMRAEISALQRRLGITTMYVTHDQVEAMTMGDRVAVMRDGVLQQLGSPLELYDRPANAFVAAFIGSPPANMLDGVVTAGSGQHELILGGHRLPVDSLPLPLGPGPILVAVRPEHARIVGAEDPTAIIHGRVADVENLGAEALCHLQVDSGSSEEQAGVDRAALRTSVASTFTVRLPTAQMPRPGTTLHLAADPAELRFFDAESGKAVA
ncbi:MAG: sn-glycerol-3-phosphate ABC transporter ATP-binding protein UgpC [Propionibacteriaceae bacterium]|nr:sn-glycerol-3-phosphate ABC transporter ATP-binding protein UgpC [Propionibacteriaceae bacterium]